ncbi:MAG: hypothetical protein K2N63_03085 [Lachnospiraceae bacterium]|nr:hypothetical protein [Lachnospiraceae bacterium]
MKIKLICAGMILLATLFMVSCTATENGDEAELAMGKHAFIMDNGLIFVADVPKDWRFALWPVYDYAYYESLVNAGTEYREENCFIKFIGEGKGDGEDNFFEIIVGKKEDSFYYEFPVTTEPFVFQDGTKGEWSSQTGRGYFFGCSRGTDIADHYEAIVQDFDKKQSIHLLMLQEEYDENEHKIRRFLESACFRENDLGEDRETDILDRDLLTLHIRERYMNLSIQMPEGVKFEREEFLGAANCKTCSYHFYLDQEKKTGITLTMDQGGEILEPTGDYRYYVNTKDFGETVYELSSKNNSYYFVNHNLWVRLWGDEKNQKLQEFRKQIVQSIRFDQ